MCHLNKPHDQENSLGENKLQAYGKFTLPSGLIAEIVCRLQAKNTIYHTI